MPIKKDDIKKQIALLKDFARKHFNDDEQRIANIESIMHGPWKQRKPTGTVVTEFFSRDVRDKAMEIAKLHKVMDGQTALDLKIERARTKSQRARNWALRKAEELAKVLAHKRSIPGTARIDFSMPVRRVLVGDMVAFTQQKDEFRSQFIEDFSLLKLPA